jgi:hypothetical protein
MFRERLAEHGFTHIKLVAHTAIGEVIPYHVQVIVGGDTIAIFYKPMSCHSYNVIKIDKKQVRVATIDTMLSLYLAFIYGNKPYFNKDRIMCMAMYLFNVQQRNRLEQKGLLKRFSLSCYGVQETLEDIRAQKAAKFNELRHGKSSEEYEYWFLKYNPNVRTGQKPDNKMETKERRAPSKTYEIPQSTIDSLSSRSSNSQKSIQESIHLSPVKPVKSPVKRKTAKRKRKVVKKDSGFAWPY